MPCAFCADFAPLRTLRRVFCSADRVLSLERDRLERSKGWSPASPGWRWRDRSLLVCLLDFTERSALCGLR
jgi:hypothetical protein